MPYPDKTQTVKEFRKAHPELKGMKLVLCEHLKNKSVDCVEYNFFAGDHTRFLLCPICHKIARGDVIEFYLKASLIIMDAGRQQKYQEWLESAGKNDAKK